MAIDPVARRLYVADQSGLLEFDLDTQALVAKNTDLRGLAGIALAIDLGRGLVSGVEDAVTIFDLKTLTVVTAVKAGGSPGAIAYDHASQRAFVLNRASRDFTAIDAASGYIAGTIPLGGVPASAVADQKGFVFITVADRNEVVKLDANSLEVLNHWPAAPCQSPGGLTVDPKGRDLFMACENKIMAVMDAATGDVAATAPTGEGRGDIAFDAELKLLFSANDSGVLTITKQEAAGRYDVTETVKTARHQYPLALDPQAHRLYLAPAGPGSSRILTVSR